MKILEISMMASAIIVAQSALMDPEALAEAELTNPMKVAVVNATAHETSSLLASDMRVKTLVKSKPQRRKAQQQRTKHRDRKAAPKMKAKPSPKVPQALPSTSPNGLQKGECGDNEHFRDEKGNQCNIFEGLLCDDSLKDYGYTSWGVKEIKENCKGSCRLCPSQECKDTEGFADERGFPCKRWVHEMCDNAVKLWGYTQAGMDNIKRNCPRSCKYCYANEDYNCIENATFLDEKGHDCESWFGTSCTLATERFKYSAEGEAAILKNCRLSCNLCLKAKKAVHDIVADELITQNRVWNSNRINRCRDTPGYTDAQGYTCAEWRRYECDLAYEAFGYSFGEEMDIIINCRGACMHTCRSLRAQEPFEIPSEEEGPGCKSDSHEILYIEECREAAFEMGLQMAYQLYYDTTGPSHCYVKLDRVYFNNAFKSAAKNSEGRAICWKSLPKFQLTDGKWNANRCMRATMGGSTLVSMQICDPKDPYQFWRFLKATNMLYSLAPGRAQCVTVGNRKIGNGCLEVTLEDCAGHENQFWSFDGVTWTSSATHLQLARMGDINESPLLAVCSKGDTFKPVHVSAEEWYLDHWSHNVPPKLEKELIESRKRVAYDYFHSQSKISKAEAAQIGISTHVIDLADRDNDGSLDPEELALAWAFVHADLNGDGSLSWDEAQQGGMTSEIFQRLDEDHHGVVTVQEFFVGFIGTSTFINDKRRDQHAQLRK